MNARQPTPKPLGSQGEVEAYARGMERLHQDGEAWLVFRLPAYSGARQFGEFGCCRAHERDDYAQGGAVFVNPRGKDDTR